MLGIPVNEYVLMSDLHIIGGVPGAWDDEMILRKLERIESECPIELRYQVLDWLYFGVINNHAYGLAADVLETIARAMDKY